MDRSLWDNDTKWPFIVAAEAKQTISSGNQRLNGAVTAAQSDQGAGRR